MSTFNQKYTVLDRLPGGSYGQTYLLKSNKDKQPLVAKIIQIESLDETQRKSTLSYLNTVKAIKHPHILQYVEDMIDDKRIIIIQEYCQYGNLYRHIEKRKPKDQYFSEHLILNWLLQMVMALDTIHKKKILHRDINLGNLFLTSNAVIKLGGCALPNVIRNDQNHLSDREFCISPQICLNQPFTQKSDIWSLGCVIYAIASLQYPFRGRNLLGLVKNVVGGKVPPISSCYSPGLKQIINKLLTKDPTKRPNSSAILFDPLMIRIMQKSMTTSNNLKKQFCITVQAKDMTKPAVQQIAKTSQKEVRVEKTSAPSSPQKAKQKDNMMSIEEMEKHQQIMLQKVKEFEKQARQKLNVLKQEIQDPKLIKGMEEELEVNIKTLYKAIDQGYKQLSSIQSPPKTFGKSSKISNTSNIKQKSLISDSKGLSIAGQLEPVGKLASSQIPFDATTKSVEVDFKDLSIQSKVRSQLLESVKSQTIQSRIFTTSSVQLTESRYIDTLELQSELNQIKSIAEEIKENPDSLLDVDFAYTLSAAGTINRKTLQKTLEQFNLTANLQKSSPNKSSIKFDMTMSKSQGKEIQNLSQEYAQEFDEYVDKQKGNKTFSEEFQKNEEMVSAYRSQLAQLEQPTNKFLVLSEIKEVSNEDSQISSSTMYRFGFDTQSQFPK